MNNICKKIVFLSSKICENDPFRGIKICRKGDQNTLNFEKRYTVQYIACIYEKCIITLYVETDTEIENKIA